MGFRITDLAELMPNPAVNRARRFMSSTWLASTRRAGYLDRWASREPALFISNLFRTNALTRNGAAPLAAVA